MIQYMDFVAKIAFLGRKNDLKRKFILISFVNLFNLVRLLANADQKVVRFDITVNEVLGMHLKQRQKNVCSSKFDEIESNLILFHVSKV